MPSVVYRSEAENRDSLSDVRGENLVNKTIAFKCKYLLSDYEARLVTGMENTGIWLVQAEKDLNRRIKI